MKNLYLNLAGGIGLFFINFWIFQFQNIPNFRDFVGTEYFYHLQYSPNISTWLHYLFNLLSTQGVNMIIAHEILFAGYLTMGFVFIFLGLQKILSLLQQDDYKGTPLENNFSQKIFLIFLSFFLVYNPWVLERILMGQLGIFLGYAVMIWNFGLMFEIIHRRADFDNSLVKKNHDQKILIFSISLLLSLLISPHYPLIVISIFSGYIFLQIFQNIFFQKSTQKFLDIFKILKDWLIVLSPSLLLLASKHLGESQYETFSSSENQITILENFSLWDEGKNFFLESLIGKNSWMSDGFVEKIFLAEDLGIFRNFSLYFSPLLQIIFLAGVLGILIFVISEFFHQKRMRLLSLSKNEKEYESSPLRDLTSSQQSQSMFEKILFFALISLPLSLLLNFGIAENSGFFREINLYFYEIPFSYIFREAGKFYALTLFSLGIIFLFFWKFLENSTEKQYTSSLPQKIFLGIFSLLLFSNFLVFLPLAKSINQPVYPEIFTALQQECKKNPSQKILYLPLRQYTTSAYSYNVFTLTPDQFLFACKRVDHNITFLGSENITLNSDSEFSALQKSVQEFSRKFSQKNTQEIQQRHQKFLEFQKQIVLQEVNYIIIDTTDIRQNTEIFLYNLVKYYKIYKYENNIFIFKVR